MSSQGSSFQANREICRVLRNKTFIQRVTTSEGAEIAEAALVLPLVFTLLLGIVWFGRAFNIYSTIQQAAQQGAITAARSSCGACGNTPAADANVTTIVESVIKASSLDPTQIAAYTPSPAPVSCVQISPPPPCTAQADHVTVCRNVQLNSSQPIQCGTLVMFSYPFNFILPGTSLNMQQITMSASAESRLEN